MDGYGGYRGAYRGRARGFRGGGGMGMRGGRGRGGYQSHNQQKTTKLFVGNLPETSDPDTLRAIFEKHGTVAECDILGTFGFVHFASPSEAEAAVSNLNDADYQGNNIRVEFSNSKIRTQPGMGGLDKCYLCGGIGHMSMECPSRMHEAEEYAPVMRRPRGRGMPATPYPRSAPLDPRDDPMYQEYLRERMAARYKPYETRPRVPAVDPYAEEYTPAYSTQRPYDDPFERPPPEFYAAKRARGARGMARGAPKVGMGGASSYQEDSAAAYGSGYTGF